MAPESAPRQLQQLLVTMAPVTLSLRVGLGATVAASFRTIGDARINLCRACRRRPRIPRGLGMAAGGWPSRRHWY